MIEKLNKIYFRLHQDLRGNVAVEFALVMSLFMLIILLGVDFSRMAVEKHRLEQYARAGTQYGLVSTGNAQNTAGVAAAISASAGPDADSLTISTTSYCECPDGVPAVCDETCADDSVPDMFLAVTVSKDYTYLFQKAAEIGGEINLQGTSTVRVR